MDISTILLISGIVLVFLRSKKFYTWICLKFKLNTLKKVKYNAKVHDPQSTKIDGNGQCYPNFDNTIWLRSCTDEIIKPIDGHVIGNIPSWLNGSLLRNGPGNWKVGDMMFQHLLDCPALLHCFKIKNGHVTYQNRFIRTETLRKNTSADKIVVGEFGTAAVPDSKHSIFDKISNLLRLDVGSDNSLMSIYPFGNDFYTFTEAPVIHKISPQTLATEQRICLTDLIGIANHSSHPHVMSNGTVYNLCMSLRKSGCVYNIVCFPHGDHMLEEAHIKASIPCRWKLNPCYMHTFGVTENYFVIIEQPLSISLMEYMKAQLCNQNLAASLKWYDNKPVLFHLIERQTGQLCRTYQSDVFFYLHIINQFEDDNHVIIDIITYEDPEMINCMYLESIMNMQSDPNYAAALRSRPLRFVLPLRTTSTNHKSSACTKSNTNQKFLKSFTLNDISNRLLSSENKPSNFDVTRMRASPSSSTANKLVHSLSHVDKTLFPTLKDSNDSTNLVNLMYTTAKAYDANAGHVILKPELLCDVSCETPRIHYERHLGKAYRYFYGLSTDVDAQNPGRLMKVDLFTKTCKLWYEDNCYPSEPIFVASPNSAEEDDGVILSTLVWGGFNENKVGLLILCAKTWIEQARCIFHTPGPVPKCLHGWFARDIV